ncbi:hypothetical protein RT97_23395 [Variovorax paradoxus]|uniref:Uncharacterized protein n=1 Tax=Variovorax paradoxus TaxID=34073 RepID=A0A0D0L994_VARPD|nr:hypothetical protein RT97_23395 [Variovorax paradoxus]
MGQTCRWRPGTGMTPVHEPSASRAAGPRGKTYRLNGWPIVIWFTPVIWIHVPASGCSSSPGLV